MTAPLLAIGADGARGGWLTAIAYGRSDGIEAQVERVELRLVDHFEAFAELRAEGVPVAVDIPMGLLDSVDRRPCDACAQKLLGARASTVFAPPTRPLLDAVSYAQARSVVAQSRLLVPTAKGLSAQAFGIAPKVREAEQYLRADPAAQRWLWECHPELSFRTLAGGIVLADKKSVGGQAERLALVMSRFPGVLDELRRFGPGRQRAETADVLDALACLDTALRVRANDYRELGGETDAAGLIMRIVF